MDWRQTFSSPVLLREMSLATSQKRFLLLRATYMIVLFGIVLILWGGFWAQTLMGSYQNQAAFGQSLFQIFVFLQFTMIMLMAPAFAGNAISKEKEQKTFELLFTTDIRNWELILSKAMGKYLILQVLILASLPLLFLIITFGGIRTEQIIGVFFLTSVCALLAVSIGIFTSTLLSRSYSSIICSYLVFILFWFAAPLLIHYKWPGMASYFNPLFSLIALLFPRVGQPSPPWFLVGLLNLAVAAALLAISILIIKKMVFWDFGQFKRDLQSARLFRFPFLKSSRHYRKGNIVYWKESRSYGWKGWVFIYVSLGAAAAFYLFSGQELFKIHGQSLEAILAVVFWFLFLDMVVIAATSFVMEKQKSTFGLLILTPLTGREIVLGKALGVFRRFVPIFLMGFLAIIFFAVLNQWGRPTSAADILMRAGYFLFLPLEIISYSFFVIMVGLFWSITARKNLSAALLGIISFITLSTPLNSCLCFLLVPLSGIANPVLVFMGTLSKILGGTSTFGEIGSNLMSLSYELRHLLFIVFHLIFGLGIYRLIVRRFNLEYVERM